MAGLIRELKAKLKFNINDGNNSGYYEVFVPEADSRRPFGSLEFFATINGKHTNWSSKKIK